MSAANKVLVDKINELLKVIAPKKKPIYYSSNFQYFLDLDVDLSNFAQQLKTLGSEITQISPLVDKLEEASAKIGHAENEDDKINVIAHNLTEQGLSNDEIDDDSDIDYLRGQIDDHLSDVEVNLTAAAKLAKKALAALKKLEKKSSAVNNSRARAS